MYRYSNGQISLEDFKQPVVMNLKESNRWVKKLPLCSKRTHIFNISAGILAMMTKNCPLIRL